MAILICHNHFEYWTDCVQREREREIVLQLSAYKTTQLSLFPCRTSSVAVIVSVRSQSQLLLRIISTFMASPSDCLAGWLAGYLSSDCAANCLFLCQRSKTLSNRQLSLTHQLTAICSINLLVKGYYCINRFRCHYWRRLTDSIACWQLTAVSAVIIQLAPQFIFKHLIGRTPFIANLLIEMGIIDQAINFLFS